MTKNDDAFPIRLRGEIPLGIFAVRCAAAITLIAAGVCTGCSQSNNQDTPSSPAALTSDGGDAQASNSCDGKGTPFVLPVTEHTPDGKFTVTLTKAVPPRFSLGDNDWTLHVTGSDGGGASGIEFNVAPWMPEHRHGSVKTVVVTDNGGGDYEAKPINVNMTGIWEIRIEFPGEGGAAQRAVFPFCANTR